MPQSTGFYRAKDELVCDGVRLADLAGAEGTPLYVYSAAALRDRYQAIDQAFGAYPHALHYALKANSTFAIARLVRELGGAADANSIWEIELARKAGFRPEAIVFTGVGKTADELECAVALGLKAINVESAGELARVEAIARRTGAVARVAVRINPDIDSGSHPHISTGLKINKFGVPLDDARELLSTIGRRSALKLVAVHVHVGSQISTLEPLRRAASIVARVSDELRASGVLLEYAGSGWRARDFLRRSRGAVAGGVCRCSGGGNAADRAPDRHRAGPRHRRPGRRDRRSRPRHQASRRVQ